MANHVRQQLRDQIAFAVTGLETTGARVFKSRAYVLQETDLPCLVVKTEYEKDEYLTVHDPEKVQRDITITIEATARETLDLDDKLDTICKEVEVAIANATTVAQSKEIVGTNIDTSVVGSRPVGRATMIYKMTVYTLADEPDTAVFLGLL